VPALTSLGSLACKPNSERIGLLQAPFFASVQSRSPLAYTHVLRGQDVHITRAVVLPPLSNIFPILTAVKVVHSNCSCGQATEPRSCRWE